VGEPKAVGAEDAELGEGFGVLGEPCGAGLFEAGLEYVAVGGLDHAGANGQVLGDGAGVVEVVFATVQVAAGAAHGGVFIGRGGWL
jgi:hypothetical protein